jgi:MFS family permease
MDTQIDRKVLRHNYVYNVFDGAFFGFAIGFASYSTNIPLFVSQLTTSAVLIGLIPAIHNTGWMLPQLFAARGMRRFTRYKPFVMFMTVNERLPIVLLGVIALLLPWIGTTAALFLSFFMLIWQGLGAGLTANPWQLMINKVIPRDYLATFFGMQSAAANLLASVGAIAAGFILEKMAAPGNFAVIFFVAGIFFLLSWLALDRTIEEPHEIIRTEFSELAFFESVKSILKKDRPFRWYIIARNLFQFGTMAFAFYIVYAVRKHGVSESGSGLLTSVLLITQVVANPVLGWLADHWNRRLVLELGAIAAAGSSLLAWLVPDGSLFFLVFILAGIANTVFWTVGMAYTLSFGDEEQRPTYVGMANTLIAPSAILAPLIGGVLADLFGYPVTFLVSTFAGILTAVILHLFTPDTQKRQANEV